MKEYQEKNVDKSVVVVKKEKVRVNENEEVIVYPLKENIGKDENLEKDKHLGKVTKAK
tara:strand:+ start:299 stop:472 length:174 start_codon:yes stop_codon:yes gene_type:complete